MKATDIFTPGKTPTVTLVEDHLVDRLQSFTDAIEQEGMLISISGPSKSGKTMFVRSIVGSENLVAITGAGFSL
jgi:tRNA A37 threonylcarbamoyladenosine biosynthesis protein TsaE